MAENPPDRVSVKRNLVSWRIAACVAAICMAATLLSPAPAAADLPDPVQPHPEPADVTTIAVPGVAGVPVSRVDARTTHAQARAWAFQTYGATEPHEAAFGGIACVYFGWLLGSRCDPYWDGWRRFVDFFSTLTEPVQALTGEHLDVAQEILGAAGLAPGIGIVFDVSNAAISMARGRHGDAIFYAAAAVPAAGISVYATVRLRKASHLFRQADNVDDAARLAKAHWVKEGLFTVWRSADGHVLRIRGDNLRGVAVAGDVPAQTRSRLRQAAGVGDSQHWTIDHSIPRALGGTNDPYNLKVLHKDANNKKSQVERILKENIEAGRPVDVDITFTGTPGVKPSSLKVDYTIGGKRHHVEIPNSSNARHVAIPGAFVVVLPGTSNAASSASNTPGTTGPGGSNNPNRSNTWSAGTLTVWRGSHKTDYGSCPASAGCRWVVGSGSGWPAGEQFWVRCGTFVDTSRNHPVQYRARYVDSSGNLSWGERICYSAGSHTVEVWTSSGAYKSVTVPASGSEPVAAPEPEPVAAPEPERHSDPVLNIWRGSHKTDYGSCPASAGCRWVVGSGSGWPAGEQFWVRCGTFVDTSRNHPVQYRARYVDSSGNLSWGERICYSAGSHTVEVWTSSGARKAVTVPA